MDSYLDLQTQHTIAMWGSAKSYTKDSCGAAHKASPCSGPQEDTGGNGTQWQVLEGAALSLLVFMNSAEKQM